VVPQSQAGTAFLEGKDQGLLDRLAAQPPLERLGQPEDTAALVAFLAGQEGHWVNGQVIRVNGGIA
jgi:3-oxoacyl-[acyl-carrier protein] reductase